MKKIIFNFLLLCAMLVQGLAAQNFTCADFQIIGVTRSATDTSEYLINIHFGADSAEYVAYPYIALVLDANGDTVAQNSSIFSLQGGQTNQEYAVTITAGADISNITALLTYNGTDTCALTYTMPVSVSRLSAPDFQAYPNPASDFVYVRAAARAYILRNNLGQTVATGRLQDGMPIDLRDLPKGVYALTIDSGRGLSSVLLVRE